MSVFLIAAVSADGKIAQQPDQVSLDWTSKEDLAFFVEKTKEAGVVVMGRKTYETIGKPLKGRLNVVMTRSAEDRQEAKGLRWISDSPEKIIESLKGEGYENIAIIGGAQVYSLFLSAGLIDELYLTVEPVLFGQGTPLAEGFDRIDLELIESRALNDRTIMQHYRVR